MQRNKNTLAAFFKLKNIFSFFSFFLFVTFTFLHVQIFSTEIVICQPTYHIHTSYMKSNVPMPCLPSPQSYYWLYTIVHFYWWPVLHRVHSYCVTLLPFTFVPFNTWDRDGRRTFFSQCRAALLLAFGSQPTIGWVSSVASKSSFHTLIVLSASHVNRRDPVMSKEAA